MHQEAQIGFSIFYNLKQAVQVLTLQPAWSSSLNIILVTPNCASGLGPHIPSTEMCVLLSSTLLLNIPSLPAWLHGGAVSLESLAWLSTTLWHNE